MQYRYKNYPFPLNMPPLRFGSALAVCARSRSFQREWVFFLLLLRIREKEWIFRTLDVQCMHIATTYLNISIVLKRITDTDGRRTHTHTHTECDALLLRFPICISVDFISRVPFFFLRLLVKIFQQPFLHKQNSVLLFTYRLFSHNCGISNLDELTIDVLTTASK